MNSMAHGVSWRLNTLTDNIANGLLCLMFGLVLECPGMFRSRFLKFIVRLRQSLMSVETVD